MTAPYSSSRFAYEGTETTEISIVRTGGAEDPAGQAQSRKIVTTANAQWLRPFRCEPWAIWNETTGADVTVTVYGMINGTPPLNDEIWMDVEYLGDASSTLGKIVTTTKANVLATGASVSSDSATWGGIDHATYDGVSTGLPYVTLSNGNRTATYSQTLSQVGARSTALQSAGKFYFEVTVVATHGNGNQVGLIESTGTYADVSASQKSVAVTSGGTLAANNITVAGSSGVLGSMAAGDIIGVAIDLNTRKAWIRRNAGGWNGSLAGGPHDPATAAGGVTVQPTVSFSPVVLFAGGAHLVGDAFTINCGQQAFTYTAPAGFGAWTLDASSRSSFKLVATLNSPQPGQPGLIHVRPKIGKASTTVYLDPQIELTPASAAPSATHKSSRYAYEGTETTETSIVRSGGTAHSRKIVTTANSQWLRPYRAEPFAIWNATTGADVTVTVYGLTFGSSLPLNDEIWAEVEYLNTTHGTIVSTTKANVLATGASVSSDASVWISGTSGFQPGANVTLSNGDLTATHANATVNAGVYVQQAQTTGKYYFEIAQDMVPSGASAVGLINPGQDYQRVFTFTEGCVALYTNSGNIAANNTSSGKNIGSLSIGNVMGLAVDLNARKAWLRKIVSGTPGNWNGEAIGISNPVTGLGGVTVGPGVFAPFVDFGAATVTGDAYTANFGATAYASPAPAGFGNWDFSTIPFKLVATLNSPQPGQPGLINVRVKAAKPSATLYIDPTPVLT